MGQTDQWKNNVEKPQYVKPRPLGSQATDAERRTAAGCHEDTTTLQGGQDTHTGLLMCGVVSSVHRFFTSVIRLWLYHREPRDGHQRLT